MLLPVRFFSIYKAADLGCLLYITYKNQQFQLEFDCRKCEMMVKKRKD